MYMQIRNRRHATRVRSAEAPDGTAAAQGRLPQDVVVANSLTETTAAVAEWAAGRRS